MDINYNWQSGQLNINKTWGTGVAPFYYYVIPNQSKAPTPDASYQTVVGWLNTQIPLYQQGPTNNITVQFPLPLTLNDYWLTVQDSRGDWAWRLWPWRGFLVWLNTEVRSETELKVRDSLVQVSWQGGMPPYDYVLELAVSPTSYEFVTSDRTRFTQLELPRLGPGHYKLTLTSLDEQVLTYTFQLTAGPLTWQEPEILIQTGPTLNTTRDGRLAWRWTQGPPVFDQTLKGDGLEQTAVVTNLDTVWSYADLEAGLWQIEVSHPTLGVKVYEYELPIGSEKLEVVTTIQPPNRFQGLGQLELEFSGGLAPYQSRLSFAPNETAEQFLTWQYRYRYRLPAGDYELLVRDSNGELTQYRNILLTIPAFALTPINLTNLSLENETSWQAKDGSIQAQAEGGLPAYQYNLERLDLANQTWLAFETRPDGDFKLLTPGTYRLRIVDEARQEFLSTLLIITPHPPLVLDFELVIQPESQPLLADGSLRLEQITAQEPITTTLTATASNTVIASSEQNIWFNLAPGNYSLTVTSLDGQIQTRVLDISAASAPPLVWLELVVVDNTTPQDNEGQITALAHGGAGQLLYNLYRADSQELLFTSLSGQFTNLNSASYKVLVQDEVGQELIGAVVIDPWTPPPLMWIQPPAIKLTTTIASRDGEIRVYAQGYEPLRYELYSSQRPNQPQVSTNGVWIDLPGLVYTIRVYSPLVTQQLPLELEIDLRPELPPELEFKANPLIITPITGPNQHNGQLEADFRGGQEPYVYEWWSGLLATGQLLPVTDRKITNLRAGRYSLRITSSDNQQIEASAVVPSYEQPLVWLNQPPVNFRPPTSLNRVDGFIQAEALYTDNDLLEYSLVWLDGRPSEVSADWGQNNFTWHNLPSGRYRVQVNDLAGQQFLSQEVDLTVSDLNPSENIQVVGYNLTPRADNLTRYFWLGVWGGRPPYRVRGLDQFSVSTETRLVSSLPQWTVWNLTRLNNEQSRDWLWVIEDQVGQREEFWLRN